MATVYLHIGAPKTATSTLQYVLAQNYKKLLKHGVLYPRDSMHGSAHHALVCDLLEKHRRQSMPSLWYGDIPRGQAWERLLAEIHRHQESVETVLLSSELFFGQVNKVDVLLRDVVDLLRGHDIRVVVYLRRQDQLYSSFYNQDVKGIRQWSQNAYQFYQTHQIFEHGYHTILDTWSNVFGKDNIIVRPFESRQWFGGDIVKDFCKLFGDISLSSTQNENNKSLGMTQLYIKRCLNRVGFDKQLNEEVLKVLYKICPEVSEKGCLYIHRTLYRKYRDQWQIENQTLSESYLKSKPLFNEPIPPAEEVKLYEVDRFGIALYVRNMFDVFKKGKYRQYRQLFSKATLLILAEQNLWNALEADSRSILLEWATTLE